MHKTNILIQFLLYLLPSLSSRHVVCVLEPSTLSRLNSRMEAWSRTALLTAWRQCPSSGFHSSMSFALFLVLTKLTSSGTDLTFWTWLLCSRSMSPSPSPGWTHWPRLRRQRSPKSRPSWTPGTWRLGSQCRSSGLPARASQKMNST